MFQSEGQHKVKITEACLCISPYDKSEQDLAVGIHGQSLSDPAQSDWWYGPLTEEYGIGNYADRKQWEITLQNLKQKLDWEHGQDMNDETLSDLVGKETEFGVKAREYNGKTYFDVKYLGAPAWGPKRVDKDAVEDRLKSIFGGSATASKKDAPKKAPVKAKEPDVEEAEVVEENPFG